MTIFLLSLNQNIIIDNLFRGIALRFLVTLWLQNNFWSSLLLTGGPSHVLCHQLHVTAPLRIMQRVNLQKMNDTKSDACKNLRYPAQHFRKH